tara:strand:- start:12585 stop:13796 length:1212 start_codon:yes stop_codon:yes gene_type:complete
MTQTTEAIFSVNKILDSANLILDHQQEIAVLKGETFNLFSILKMESKENDTHSAFLGELLNPNGSHNFGASFLQLFLNQIDDETLDADSSKVILEYHIGLNNHDDKTGGRVDIYIKDASENTICIENKIYASDQPNQLKRYANHNKTRNKVYYLTLYGDDASDDSKDNLKIDVDYRCISYHTTIIDWLEACSKEASDQPILRETIKQYIILLKKLTNQLSDAKMEKEIKEIIINNYNAAKTISSNIESVELEYGLIFLNEIKHQLEIFLNKEEKDWTIEVSEDLRERWTGLYISHKNWPPKTFIQLQGTPLIPLTNTAYGVVAHNSEIHRSIKESILKSVSLFETGFRSTPSWPFHKIILWFGNSEERAKLFDKNLRSELVTFTVEKLVEISRVCERPLSELK